jgi:glycine betaine/proline transport system substrate-binding protein
MTTFKTLATSGGPAARSLSRRSALVGTAGLMGLGLAACSTEVTGGDDDSGSDGGGAGGTITLGYVKSWTDGLSTAYLLDNQLSAAGYTVEHKTIEQPAVLYEALAKGDVDIDPSAWPEVTHKDYMDANEGNIEDLGAYYDNAVLTIAVPDYMDDVTSIADLKGQGDRFGGKIIGIEPGAGLTKAATSMIEEYGLGDEYELVTSSTSGMLSELDKATSAESDIVVTLWRPFWANNTYPVRDLEDPEGAMGDSEKLHFLAHTGFSEEYPDLAEFIGGIKLDDEQYGSLEDLVVNDYEGKEDEAVEKWLEDNPDVLPELSSGS